MQFFSNTWYSQFSLVVSADNGVLFPTTAKAGSVKTLLVEFLYSILFSI